MKTRRIWLAFLCVILAFSGCQSSLDENTWNTSPSVEEPSPGPLFNAPAPLSAALKEEIEDAWGSQYGVAFAELGSWCNMDEEKARDNAIRYYGRFESYDVLFIEGPFFAITYENVADFTFSHVQSFSIEVYRDGEFQHLKDVYHEGKISADAIEEIYNLHRNFEQEVFGFDGEDTMLGG